MRLIDADKIEYTSIAHLASYPVAPSPCDTVMRAEINAIPTVDAEPVRHGRWVEEVTDDGKGFPRTEYTCPFCQYKTRADTNYCPECGARLSEDGITK